MRNRLLVEDMTGFASETLKLFQERYNAIWLDTLNIGKRNQASYRKKIKDHDSRIHYLYEATTKPKGEDESTDAFNIQINSRDNETYILKFNRDIVQFGEEMNRLIPRADWRSSPNLFSIQLTELSINDEGGIKKINDIFSSALEETLNLAVNYYSIVEGLTNTGIEIPGYRGSQDNARRAKLTKKIFDYSQELTDIDTLIALRSSMFEDGNESSFLERRSYLPVSYNTTNPNGEKKGISRRNSEFTLMFSIKIYSIWFENYAHTPTDGISAVDNFNNQLKGDYRLRFLKKGRKTILGLRTTREGNSNIYNEYVKFLGKLDTAQSTQQNVQSQQSSALTQTINDAVTPQHQRVIESNNQISTAQRLYNQTFNTTEQKKLRFAHYKNRRQDQYKATQAEFMELSRLARAAHQTANTKTWKNAQNAEDGINEELTRSQARARREVKDANRQHANRQRSNSAEIDQLRREFRQYLHKRKTDCNLGFFN